MNEVLSGQYIYTRVYISFIQQNCMHVIYVLETNLYPQVKALPSQLELAQQAKLWSPSFSNDNNVIKRRCNLSVMVYALHVIFLFVANKK